MASGRGTILIFLACAAALTAQEPTSAEQDAAGRLALRKTQAARLELLAAENTPVTPGVIRAVLHDGDGLEGIAAYREAIELYRLGLRLAEQSRDRSATSS